MRAAALLGAMLLSQGIAHAQTCPPETDVAELAADPLLDEMMRVCAGYRALHPEQSEWIEQRDPGVRELATSCGEGPLPCAAAGLRPSERAARVRRAVVWIANVGAIRTACSALSDSTAVVSVDVGGSSASVPWHTAAGTENARASFEAVCLQPGTIPAEPEALETLVRNVITLSSLVAARTVPDRDTLEAARLQILVSDGSHGAVDAPAGAATAAASVFSTLLEGLAIFLANRAQAELQQFVIDRMRVAICTAPGSGDGQPTRARRAISSALLVDTCMFLGSSDASLPLGATLGDSFIAAVVADVTRAPQRLAAKLADAEWLAHLGIDPPAAATAVTTVRLGLGVFDAIGRATSIADLGNRLAAIDLPETVALAPLRRAIRAFEALARLVRREVGATETETAVIARIRGQAEALLDTLLPELSSEAQEDLTELLEALVEIDRTFDRLGAGNTVSPEDRAEAVRILVRAVLRGVTLLVESQLSGAADDARPLLTGAVAAIDTAAALTQPGDVAGRVAAVLQLIAQLLETLDASTTVDVTMPSSVVRVVSLAADLAGADEPEDAARIMDAFAAPVGSWRAKAHRPLVALNGMVGFLGGGDFALSTDLTPAGSEWFAAPSASVGLDVTLVPFAAGHVGLYVPVIDVGALVVVGGADPVATPRTDDPATSPTDESTTIANARTELDPVQFLTPGLALRLGFEALPVVLLVGLTVVPRGRLRLWDEVDASGAIVGRSEAIPAVRLFVGAAVDITILPF